MSGPRGCWLLDAARGHAGPGAGRQSRQSRKGPCTDIRKDSKLAMVCLHWSRLSFLCSRRSRSLAGSLAFDSLRWSGVAGQQPPPCEIGLVSPLVHSVSNISAADEDAGSVGRSFGGRGGSFSGGAFALRSESVIPTAAAGFLCGVAGRQRGVIVGVQVPSHGYRRVRPSRNVPWGVKQRRAAWFVVHHGWEAGIFLGLGGLASLDGRNPETRAELEVLNSSMPSNDPSHALSTCNFLLTSPPPPTTQTSYVHPSLLRIRGARTRSPHFLPS